jgi:hypothetical protein
MWIVLVRATKEAKWAAHGPFEYKEASNYERSLAATGMERQMVKLIKPWAAITERKETT